MSRKLLCLALAGVISVSAVALTGCASNGPDSNGPDEPYRLTGQQDDESARQGDRKDHHRVTSAGRKGSHYIR